MWAKVVFQHPSVRRFKTAVGLTGTVLTQEVSGAQQRTVSAIGATPEEYTILVRDAEQTDFVDGLQASASEMIHFGINTLSVEISGTRKIPVGVVYPAAYTYTQNCGR